MRLFKVEGLDSRAEDVPNSKEAFDQPRTRIVQRLGAIVDGARSCGVDARGLDLVSTCPGQRLAELDLDCRSITLKQIEGALVSILVACVDVESRL